MSKIGHLNNKTNSKRILLPLIASSLAFALHANAQIIRADNVVDNVVDGSNGNLNCGTDLSKPCFTATVGGSLKKEDLSTFAPGEGDNKTVKWQFKDNSPTLSIDLVSEDSNSPTLDLKASSVIVKLNDGSGTLQFNRNKGLSIAFKDSVLVGNLYTLSDQTSKLVFDGNYSGEGEYKGYAVVGNIGISNNGFIANAKFLFQNGANIKGDIEAISQTDNSNLTVMFSGNSGNKIDGNLNRRSPGTLTVGFQNDGAIKMGISIITQGQ